MLTKEKSFSVIVHSSGWGANFRKGKNNTALQKYLFEIELVSSKHPKEVKVINPYFPDAKSYVYGKKNSLILLRGGVGLQRINYRKPYWGGVEVRTVAFGGLSIGILKPSYLFILNSTGKPYEFDLTTEKYDPNKHFTDNIYGRASSLKGFENLGFMPGLYGKLGLNFEYGTYDADIKAIETGISLDAFPKNLPLMAFNENKKIFFQLYVSIHFGKRDF